MMLPALILLASVAARPALAEAGSYRDLAIAMTEAPPAGSVFREDLEAELLRLANTYRIAEGRRPLTAGDAFRTAARAHAADMMLHDFVGHRASTGHDLEGRIAALAGDVTRFPRIGENAARDTRNTPVDGAKARALFRQWVESRSHRRQLLSRSYEHVSTGVIQRGNSIWAVQIFYATPRERGLFR